MANPSLEFPLPAAARRIFCNRTLNLRAIKAVGFDMDYTLVHYRVEAWEREAFDRALEKLAARGWPVVDLRFDLGFATLGLILDLELGNVVKANRFGYVTRASHGTRMLDFEEQRRTYSQVLVDLSNPRWRFVSTLFSLSETSLYAQLVDLLDRALLPTATGYGDLHRIVRQSMDEVHIMGALKEAIMADPGRFVELDPELPLALLDLKFAGKKLLVITNSEWPYTSAMLAFAFDRYLPPGRSWRDLFDLVIVSARKPLFFTQSSPVFEVVDDRGLLRPHSGPLITGRTFLGGHAEMVERDLGLAGEEILYMGDHIHADVRVSKEVLRWRTALVLRELETELVQIEGFKPQQAKLTGLMTAKEKIEHTYSSLKLRIQRLEGRYGPEETATATELRRQLQATRTKVLELDAQIAPLARAATELVNARWGPVMRAGNDKSHLARQIENSADIYMSRVSNLLHTTPFVYLRAPRGNLPHDSGPAGGTE